MFNQARELDGVQIGLVNTSEGSVRGVQLGVVNDAWQLRGVQFGFINYSEFLSGGVQFGLFNVVPEQRFDKGVQIGVLNISLTDGWFDPSRSCCMVIPFVNARF